MNPFTTVNGTLMKFIVFAWHLLALNRAVPGNVRQKASGCRCAILPAIRHRTVVLGSYCWALTKMIGTQDGGQAQQQAKGTGASWAQWLGL
jgi:hypothetical protein